MPSKQNLDHITIKGFKSIASIQKLRLNPVNLLIGANGSGKSNFIGVFSFLHAVRENRLQDYVRRAGGADQILHFGAKHTKEIEIRVSFNDEVNQYKLVLRPNENDTLYPAVEQVFFWDKQKGYTQPWDQGLTSLAGGLEAGISSKNLKATASWVQHRLDSWRVYHVHDTSASSPMRKTAKLNDNSFLRPDGSNLPAFLYRLQRRYPESYRAIRATIQRVGLHPVPKTPS